MVDFLRRMAVAGFDHDGLTGVATRHSFIHRFRTGFDTSGREVATESIGCFRVDSGPGNVRHSDTDVKPFCQSLDVPMGANRWFAGAPPSLLSGLSQGQIPMPHEPSQS
jgi:hypothetical protein